VAIAVAALLIPISARAADQNVENSSRKLDAPGTADKEGRPVTVESGNGGSITLDASVAQRASSEKGSPAHAIRWQLVAFECGNGGTMTFLIPAAQQTANEESSAVQPESQSVNSIGRPSSKAQANSPPFHEEHLDSDGIAIPGEEAKAKAERIKKQMDKRKENVAWAASPRTREEFPELQRVPLSLEEQQAKAERIRKQMDKRKENVAWAASPRTREEFPELRFEREPEVSGHGEQEKPKSGYVSPK
jgi:hypothetical protein